MPANGETVGRALDSFVIGEVRVDQCHSRLSTPAGGNLDEMGTSHSDHDATIPSREAPGVQTSPTPPLALNERSDRQGVRIPVANRYLLTTAATGHFLNDFYAAFLAPLLPLVVARFEISLTLAGLLATVLNTSAALSQPLFGALADRMRRRLFVLSGPMMTIVAMGLMGLAPSYAVLLILLLLAGTGTASFHPQGASTAGSVGGAQRSVGLSIFVASGQLGFALGPLVIALVVATYGLRATWAVALPGLLACLVLVRPVTSSPIAHAPRERSLVADLRGALRPMVFLWVIAVLRQVIVYSYSTFLPLLLRERGATIVVGGAAVFLFGGVGSVGGMLGATLSDRVGGRAVQALSLILGPPLLVAFNLTRGPAAYWLLAAAGICTYLSASVTVVMAQELLPQRASVASSIVMGLAWAVAGLSLTGVGALADAFGLGITLTLIPVLAAPALVAVAALPMPRSSIPDPAR